MLKLIVEENDVYFINMLGAVVKQHPVNEYVI